MPRFTRSTKRTPRAPAFFAAARTFYGDAFGARKRKQLEEAMTDWAELPEEDRSFALAHLLYLNLMAHAGVHRLLAQTRNLLDEMAEEIGEVADRAPEPDGDEDLFDGEDGDGNDDLDHDDLGPAPSDAPVAPVAPVSAPATQSSSAACGTAAIPVVEGGELLDGDEGDEGDDDEYDDDEADGDGGGDDDGEQP